MGKKSRAKKQAKRDRKAQQQSAKKRMYAAAKAGRLDFTASSSSADSELYTSLSALRNKSRALVRDVVYAKRAKTITVNNVIGTGVGMQAQVRSSRNGRLLKRVNDGIESAWKKWCRAESCHTGGSLHFADIERLCMGEVFEAGEVFLRLHTRQFGDSAVPLGIEVIEAERIADDHEIQATPAGVVTMGIEHDEFGRPLAYYIHSAHPALTRQLPAYQRGEILRVPADQIIHIKLIDRWPQVRGVPLMHASINRLNQLGEYEDAALVAARIGASKVGFFEATDYDTSIAEGAEIDGTPSTTVEAGEFTQLPPGYKFASWNPEYPHQNFDPFTRASLRGISAGVGPSYESLSRDYSQSNYSSSRLALLDDRDLWRSNQAWWVRSVREPIHRIWMQLAVMSNAIPEIDKGQFAGDIERFSAVRFKPRGWSWIDPTKEVAAYKEAERAGYMTKSDIIAATAGGADIEDVIAGRQSELDMLDDAALSTDTTDAARSDNAIESNDFDADDQEVARLRAVADD